MHHPTGRITHTTAFVTPVVEHWLEREIVQWVHPMKDRSDDPSHHERTLLPRSYISLILHNDDAWRQQDSEWFVGGCFAIHSVKPRTVPVVFVAEGFFGELCDPGRPRGVLLGINLPILLAMVRHEYCFAVDNLSRLVQCMVWYCHVERHDQ